MAYSPKCLEGEFSEVGALTRSSCIHRFGLGLERGRRYAYRGPFPSGRIPCPPLLYTTLGADVNSANFAITEFSEVRGFEGAVP